ncbi:MAG: DUF6320 domain-containing protein [Treponema sp.]|jgi:hypothetical protein|nr:DUF6320 domain-containing protein [Treponema sp.]
MLRCEHCGVSLPGTQGRCPLCQSEPAGDPDGSRDRFPRLPESRRTVSRALITWLAFESVCVVVICITVNITVPAGGWWSMFVLAGVVSLWIDFAVVLKKQTNPPKSIIWQVTVVSLMAFLWDICTTYKGWSLEYVLPILSTAAMLAMTVVAKVRNLDIQDYILYLVIACVFGIVSFVLILTGAVRVVIPSAINFCAAVVFLAFLLFFEGKALWAEFQRRLHW